MADTIFKTEEKPEIDRFVELIQHMDDGTQNRILIFMQGVKFAENVNKETLLISK